MKKCLLNIALMECPRCGGSHQLEFFALTSVGYTSDFNLFATCPTTQEPIFLSVPEQIPNEEGKVIQLPIDVSDYKRILEAKPELPAASHDTITLNNVKQIIGADKDVVQFIKDLQQATLNLRAYLSNFLESGVDREKVTAMLTWLGFILHDRTHKFENHMHTEESFKLVAPQPFGYEITTSEDEI